MLADKILEYTKAANLTPVEALREVMKALVALNGGLTAMTRDVMGLDNLDTKVRHFVAIDTLYEQLGEAKKHYNDLYDRLSREELPDAIRAYTDATGLKPPFNIEGVGKVLVSHKYSCSMVDKDAAMEWLKKTGNEALVSETVNSSTLAAFAKNKEEVEGMELPADLFKTGRKPYISIRAK